MGRGITDLEHTFTSSVSEDALVRGYGVPELSITRLDDRPRPIPIRDHIPIVVAIPRAEYSVGHRLFRPCACGTFVGAVPGDQDDIAERLEEHHESPEHVLWRYEQDL